MNVPSTRPAAIQRHARASAALPSGHPEGTRRHGCGVAGVDDMLNRPRPPHVHGGPREGLRVLPQQPLSELLGTVDSDGSIHMLKRSHGGSARRQRRCQRISVRDLTAVYVHGYPLRLGPILGVTVTGSLWAWCGGGWGAVGWWQVSVTKSGLMKKMFGSSCGGDRGDMYCC